jgi:hypothetical protein
VPGLPREDLRVCDGDYKRKEENDAAMVRLAKEVMGLIDTAPCELPAVWPDFQHSNEKEPA